MPPTRQLVGNKILCPACLVKEKKIRRREENPWGSSTFFETPKYPRATDIRLLSELYFLISKEYQLYKDLYAPYPPNSWQ